MQRRQFLSALAATTSALAGQSSPSSPLLTGLRSEHPRLLLTAESFEAARASLDSDEWAAAFLFRLRRHGDELLRQGAVRYELIGPRLLAQSRRLVEQAYVLSTLARLEPSSSRWLEGLRASIHSAAHFPDWNPSHFLDTAEMTHAFAIAYDWAFDLLPEDEKAMLLDAIVAKGLKPAIAGAYRGGKNKEMAGWAARRNNWNQVCNGGMILGALSIAERDPALAEEILGYAIRSLPLAMRSFAPDGGWFEGVAYWAYTMRYT
ncbi:MAG: hypothetical protein LC114_10990, partial [Bryobacterales bacterium]|nr:hypothetical protein [Bryobacterales bacterium]